MALFPAGASFLVYYPTIPSSTNMLGTSVNFMSAAREGVITRLFPAGNPATVPGALSPQGVPPSYPNGLITPIAVANMLPVGAIPVGYASWGLRRVLNAAAVNSDWLEIADTISMDPPMEKTGQAQVTVLKSLQRSREYIPGFVDGDTVKCKAKHSHRLYAFLHNPPVLIGGVPVPDVVDATGLAGPPGGLRLLTTLFAIVYPPNFGQGELVFGAQQVWAGFLVDKGEPTFSSEEDKTIELDFSIKVTGPVADYPGA